MRKLLPNAITALRLLLLVPFGWAVLVGRPRLAFGLLAVMALSDAADGYLARRWRASTPLGAFLDPLADKLTQILAYGTLRIRHRLGDVTVRPRWEGKASTLCIFVLLLAACLGAPAWFVLTTSIVAAPLVVASGVHYVLDGVAQVRRG